MNLPLGAPNPIEAAPNPSPDGDYTVTWAAVSGAIRYRLEERQGTTGSWDLAQFGPGTSKTYTNKPQGTYQYRAKACSNTTGTICGSYSVTETVTVQGCGGCGQAPHAPLALSVSPNPSLDGDYTVSWGESLTATEYNLEEQFGSGGWVPVGNPLDPNLILRSWSPNPPKTVNGVYTYRVNACNQYGCSDWANSQPSVTVDVFPPPATVWAMPNSVQVPLSGPPATYKIKWDAVAGATWYEVKRRDSCGGPTWYDPVDYPASPAQYNAYIPAGCDDSANFYYSVRACKTGPRCSNWSGLPEAAVHVTHGQINLTGTAQATYLHTDALGSVVAETDEAGAVTEWFHYEPYGAPTDQTYTQEPGYTGHVMDAKTELVYMQARYMDPLAGRFLSVDPARSGFNLYAYANNNPYRYVDPDGRASVYKYPDKKLIVVEQTFKNNGTQFTDQQISNQGSALSGQSSDGTTVSVRLRPGNDSDAVQINPDPNLDDTSENPLDRSHTDKIGGRQVSVAPNATDSTVGHEMAHPLGAGDQYGGGIGADGKPVTSDVPGPQNIMKDGVGRANQQTINEIQHAATSSSGNQVFTCSATPSGYACQ